MISPHVPLHCNPLSRLWLVVIRYDFEYEDDDDVDEGGDIGIENKYYSAKQIKADNPDEAIDEFLGVPALEQDKGEWSVHSPYEVYMKWLWQ